MGAAAITLAATGLYAAAPAVPQYIAAAVANPERPDFDRQQDANRKPAEMLVFAGIKPGMKIVELAPGQGYYTRILSVAVGGQGKVTGISSRPLNAVNEWAQTHAQVVTMDDAKPGTIPVQSIERFDLVWTTRNYHDFKNAKSPDGTTDAAAGYNAAAFEVLKPGGAYLVSDHEAAKGAGATVTSTLHRIESALVIKEVEAAGFKLEAQGNFLRNPADSHTVPMRDGSVAGKTDQFVLLFRKPK